MLGSMMRLVGGLGGKRRRTIDAAEIRSALEEAGEYLPDTLDTLRDKTIERLDAEIKDFARRSGDQRLGVRYHLATNVMGFAQYGCLLIPDEPEPDPLALRGEIGITGKLRAHIVELVLKDEDVGEQVHEETLDPEQVSEALCTAIAAGLAASHQFRMEFWNHLRLRLDDVTEPDWLAPFVAAMFASAEETHRRSSGLESVLERDHAMGAAAADHIAKLFVNVVQGVDDPYSAWLAAATP